MIVAANSSTKPCGTCVEKGRLKQEGIRACLEIHLAQYQRTVLVFSNHTLVYDVHSCSARWRYINKIVKDDNVTLT